MMAWSEFDLHIDLLKGLHKNRFFEPTPIQKACLGPAIRERKDIIGAAQTGSGKTLAFGLPILRALLEEKILDELHVAAKQSKKKQIEDAEKLADKYYRESLGEQPDEEGEEEQVETEDQGEEEGDEEKSPKERKIADNVLTVYLITSPTIRVEAGCVDIDTNSRACNPSF